MLRPRLIPCLLLKNGGLIKTVKFSSPKYIGDPLNAIKIFNEKKADELVLLDINATAESRLPDFSLVERIARECQMPLCFGGGVNSLEVASRLIGLGVEKVAISSAALTNPSLIKEISEEIGSQSLSVVLDIKQTDKGWEIWRDNGKKRFVEPFLDFMLKAQDLGVGEIVLNSIDLDGTMKGYDLELAKFAKKNLKIPFSICGGAGSRADIKNLYDTVGLVGAAVGSLFVYKGPYKAVLINYPNPSERSELFPKN